MDELEAIIHQFLTNANEGAALGQLTIHQLKEVIRIGGLAAGLTVKMEYRVPVKMFEQQLRGFVDCVWRRPDDGAVIVAWEIDGINVTHHHVHGHLVPPPWRKNAVGIIRKLSATNAPVKVHALYSIRPGLRLEDHSELVQQWHDKQMLVDAQQVRVHKDSNLLAGTLMQIINQVQTYNQASDN
jgi:hypothetical protein